MPGSTKYLSYIYFAISILVLGVYGIRIFPHFDQPVHITLAALVVPFVGAALLKYFLEARVVDQAPLLLRPRRQFFFDLGMYLLVGLATFVFLAVIQMQPVFMGMKLVIGILIIGYFASIDNALTRERFWFQDGDRLAKADFKVAPLSNKLSLFLTLTILISMVITTLAAYGDLGQLAANPDIEPDLVRHVFIIDILFIFAIVLVLTLRLIHSYSLNLQQIFNTQLNVLRNVESGRLDEYVPIMTRDEFGLIAKQINTMIDGIRDKEQLRKMLERIVSPSIMEKLLTTDDKTLKYGQEYDVAILFCDLRDFTRFTEAATAEDVIFFLNAYFSQMVRIVTEHNGIVNKFMGDAILAVYGLEKGTNPAEDAVATSWAILEHASQVKLPDGTHLDIGVGIHSGTVVAGTIGSEDRYEYTFIGDAVNTASRLDGLTKRLGYNIIISSDAYNELGEWIRSSFADLGKHQLRGKAEPIHVFASARSLEIDLGDPPLDRKECG